jgi:DNA-binding IclR family transcriptional regulator
VAITSDTTTPTRAVSQSLRLLETVAGHPDGITPEELARAAGIAPAQVTRLLPMLRREGYVDRLPDGALVAGEALMLLGAGGEQGRLRLRDSRLQQVLDGLREAVGAAIYLGRYVDGEMVVPRVSATPEVPTVHEWVDFRASAHATAIGKCLLSQLDHDGRQDHLSRHKAARLTSRTITDQRVLLSALERQPATMPVLDLQEYAVGTLCAAVPLTAGSTVGCLALSLPVSQAHRLRRAAEALNDQAAPALLSLAL